jgi:polyhydroxybutyrate depolymerase
MNKYYFRPNSSRCGRIIADSVIGLLIFSLLASVVAAATPDSKNVSKSEMSFVYNGKNYSALLYKPESNSTSVAQPLVIVASGVGDRLSRFIRATGFARLAGRHGFVVAYAQIDQHEDWYNWLNSSSGSVNQGAVFFRTIISGVSKEANIAAQNIYLTGFSAGGALVLGAMCDMANEVAAFGVVSASLPSITQMQCPIKRAVPAIIFASRDDPVFPWNGGLISFPLTEKTAFNVLSISDTVDLWRTNNRCNARPLLEAFDNVDPSDGTTVTRLMYDFGCRNSSHVLLYAITGGGHSWPGSIIKLRSFEGTISQDIQASDAMWEFFSKYSLEQ